MCKSRATKSFTRVAHVFRSDLDFSIPYEVEMSLRLRVQVPFPLIPLTSDASQPLLCRLYHTLTRKCSYTINVGSHHSSTSPWMSCTSVLKELFLALGKASSFKGTVGHAAAVAMSSAAPRSARMFRYFLSLFFGFC